MRLRTFAWLGVLLLGTPDPALAQAPATPPAPAAEQVRLSPMDKLSFRIEQDPAKANDPDIVAVSALEEIEFTVSHGSSTRVLISSKGKTLSEVKQELKAKLDADYYQDARIELRLIDRTQRSSQILVYGAVRNNLVPISPGDQRTLLEAVLQAGPTEFARLSKVKLHRFNPTTQTNETRTIDVESIKKSGDKSKDILLQDGDRIEVPERSVVF